LEQFFSGNLFLFGFCLRGKNKWGNDTANSQLFLQQDCNTNYQSSHSWFFFLCQNINNKNARKKKHTTNNTKLLDDDGNLWVWLVLQACMVFMISQFVFGVICR